MTENFEPTGRSGQAGIAGMPRRRSSDHPPRLDPVTLELVRQFIEIQRRPAPPPRSILRKLLDADRP